MKDEVHQLPELMPDKRMMLLVDAELKLREGKFLLKIAERVWKQARKQKFTFVEKLFHNLGKSSRNLF